MEGRTAFNSAACARLLYAGIVLDAEGEAVGAMCDGGQVSRAREPSRCRDSLSRGLLSKERYRRPVQHHRSRAHRPRSEEGETSRAGVPQRSR